MASDTKITWATYFTNLVGEKLTVMALGFASPLQKLRKVDPVHILTLRDYKLYFGKTGKKEMVLSPIAAQEVEKKAEEVNEFFCGIAEQIAKDYDISEIDALQLAYGMDVSDDNGTKIQVNLDNYLGLRDRLKLAALQRESKDLPIEVSVLLMQNRILYSVQVLDDAKLGDRKLSIEDPWFSMVIPLVEGMKLKAKGTYVEITKPYDHQTGTIGVKALSTEIPAGTTLYVVDEAGSYKMGMPECRREWVESLLSVETEDGSKSDVQLLYDFYLEESGRKRTSEEVSESAEKKSLSEKSEKILDSESTQNLLTGNESTGELNLLESQILA